MKKVTFPHMNSLHILQVGAGGIGSAVAADLARLIYSVRERCTISYRIADGDRVEESNLLRQNFINPDLAKNKAMVLAERYSRAYGIPISYFDQYVTDKETFDDLLFPPDGYDWHKDIIMIGCVDDNGARKLMHEVFMSRYNILWLDGGNETYDGQVVLGYKKEGIIILPPVSRVYKDILEAGAPQRSLDNCAAVVAEKPQAYSANKMAATIMMSFLYNIIVNKACETHMATFDCRNIMVRPWYIEDLKQKTKTDALEDNLAVVA